MPHVMSEKIEQIFDNLSLNPEGVSLLETKELRRIYLQEQYAKACVHIVYLKDEQGLVQALIAHNQILDIHSFSQHLNRPELRALSKTETSRLKGNIRTYYPTKQCPSFY